jgi:hypothetical protein
MPTLSTNNVLPVCNRQVRRHSTTAIPKLARAFHHQACQLQTGSTMS